MAKLARAVMAALAIRKKDTTHWRWIIYTQI